MFTGFVKGIPLEIEEAALIDGCNPLQVFFKILIPILKPTIISTAILQLMWVWNDYLLPTLVLDIKKYRTIPIDLFYDIERIGNIISPPSSIIGFKPDGSIYNIGSDGNPLEHNIFNESLRDILKESFSIDQES